MPGTYVPGARLAGTFWDDLYKGATAVGELAATVQRGAIAGREVQSGNAQVTVIPTRQGAVNYTMDYGPKLVPIVIAGGALLAFMLSQRGGRRRRR